MVHGQPNGGPERSPEAEVKPDREMQPDRDMLREIVEALQEPALVVTAGRVAMSNAAARTLLGRHIDGEDVRVALRHPAALERLMSGENGDDQVELVGVGGPEQRWLMTVTTVAGGSRFVRLTNRSEAHAAEQMRVDFVANASHELRTPLATILGYAETLKEQDGEVDAATRHRFMGTIYDEARRMQRLVEDLISLSRIEAERFSVPTDVLQLKSLIGDACDHCRLLASRNSCEFDIEVDADLPLVIGDRAQIMQLIENLISNAVRYGRRGRPVYIRAFPERSMVHLSVRDEGDGIPAEHIPRITERFYRVDPSRSRAQGGTGLGLSIVKHIVERHRGRLRIASKVGEGTTVHVQLPAAGSSS